MALPLRAIVVFDVVARCRSLSKAAAELYVTPSAVSQQIHALELHLGTTLLTKAGRGVVLTEAGERYFEMIADDVQRITEATQRIRGFRSRSVLTVRTTPTLGSKWLLPRLRSFLDANPDVFFSVTATTEFSTGSNARALRAALPIWRQRPTTRGPGRGGSGRLGRAAGLPHAGKRAGRG